MGAPDLLANLLIVDDDPSMVRLVTTIIERGFRGQIKVESLTDSAAALARIESVGVSILLTDLDMPEIDGLKLLRSAKKRNPSAQVVFLTGQSRHAALLEALELGASDYILKPVDRQQLLDLVEQSLARHHRWQKAIVTGATIDVRGKKRAVPAVDVSGNVSFCSAVVGKVKYSLSVGIAALTGGDAN